MTHCLGCGEDLQCKKPYQRRVLYTVQGEQVREMWKEVISSKVTVSGLDLDIDSMVGTKENPGFMCHSCFDKYKTLVKLREEMLQKLENVEEVHSPIVYKHWNHT